MPAVSMEEHSARRLKQPVPFRNMCPIQGSRASLVLHTVSVLTMTGNGPPLIFKEHAMPISRDGGIMFGVCDIILGHERRDDKSDFGTPRAPAFAVAGNGEEGELDTRFGGIAG